MSNELTHHGIKGQKWGIRRFQRKDGSLTNAGKKRYYDTPELNKKKSQLERLKAKREASNKEYSKAYNKYGYFPTSRNRKAYEKALDQYAIDDKVYRKAKLSYVSDPNNLYKEE